MSFLTLLDKPEFNPQHIYDLQIWIDASDISTITKDGADKVSQIDDKSGKGNNATQIIAANQPLFITSHINDKSVLTFDGVSNEMDLTSTISFAGEFTMFFVANNSNTTASRVLLGHNVNNNKIAVINPTVAFERIIASGSGDLAQAYSAQNVTAIQSVRRNSSDKIDMAFNGASFTRLFSDVAQSGVSSWNKVAGDNIALVWEGDIAEIIIYDRAISELERRRVENYLSEKWGIAL